jgi:hypothetical protein
MKKYKYLILLLLTVTCIKLNAQDTDSDDDSNKPQRKGFHFGLSIGPYWANKYTASLYDGYGLDADGNRNEFQNSLMYQKIVNEYGGGNGYTDRIAQELKCDPQTWKFDESDMPVNMRYNIAFMVGLCARYATDNQNAIIINVNAEKIKVTGNFTIETPVNPNSNQLNNGVNTCAIAGSEQRMQIQFGYCRILGDRPRGNFFVEFGLNATLAKFDKNQIQVGSLIIDLTSPAAIPGTYTPYATGYTTLEAHYLRGIGFGAFGVLGYNLTITKKWTVQLMYDPTYEKVNIGLNPRYRFNHACGIRMYYNF